MMMTKQNNYFMALVTAFAMMCIAAGTVYSKSNSTNLIDDELHKVRYNYAQAVSEGMLGYDESGGDSFNDNGMTYKDGNKSAGKAFLMSLAVPGLGQYYYGSKIKSAAFLGIEATSWLVHVSWHKKGEELTDEFEAFNDAHWSQTVYEDYLETVYGVRDDELAINAPELSHNLPDTKTQQYYEMTGKYNQFAWGWDDATFNGMDHNDFDSAAGFPTAITSPTTTPYSPRRLLYENMRNEANKKLDNANKMLMVVVANHLISAVEAYITTKARNNSGGRSESGFSNLKINPSLKSYNERSDTPYMSVSYKF